MARLNPETDEIETLEVLSFSTRLLRHDVLEIPPADLRESRGAAGPDTGTSDEHEGVEVGSGLSSCRGTIHPSGVTRPALSHPVPHCRCRGGPSVDPKRLFQIHLQHMAALQPIDSI